MNGRIDEAGLRIDSSLYHFVVEEAADDATHTPQMVFDCAFDGPNRIRVIGYEVGSKDLMAMRFVLHRE